MRESLKKAQEKYSSKNRKTYQIFFQKEKEKELIEYFDSLENKSKFVKNKIREELDIIEKRGK